MLLRVLYDRISSRQPSGVWGIKLTNEFSLTCSRALQCLRQNECGDCRGSGFTAAVKQSELMFCSWNFSVMLISDREATIHFFL